MATKQNTRPFNNKDKNYTKIIDKNQLLTTVWYHSKYVTDELHNMFHLHCCHIFVLTIHNRYAQIHAYKGFILLG